jgi:hypothetical protein
MCKIGAFEAKSIFGQLLDWVDAGVRIPMMSDSDSD